MPNRVRQRGACQSGLCKGLRKWIEERRRLELLRQTSAGSICELTLWLGSRGKTGGSSRSLPLHDLLTSSKLIARVVFILLASCAWSLLTVSDALDPCRMGR